MVITRQQRSYFADTPRKILRRIAVSGHYRVGDPVRQLRKRLRELQRINLELPEQAILGQLDDYITRSGYRITPVVIWSGKDSED